jgi:Xaa-Pro aminopeptidase
MPHSSRPDWSGRLAVLQTSLVGQQLDALVVSQLRNLAYLTGFSGSAGLLVARPDGAPILILDGRYTVAARHDQDAGSLAVVPVEAVERRYDLSLADVLTRLGARRVGFEAAQVTVAALAAWQRALPAATWVSTEGIVERQRLIKDVWEQETFRRAGRLLAGVAGRIPEWLRAGRSEQDVADDLGRGIRAAGFSATAFPTIVASGPNSAHPHARPGSRVIQLGDLVVLDFGGVLDGYCVDLTRTAAVGPVSDRARALFEAVYEANRAARQAVKPGVDVSVIDQAARAVLEDRGLGAAFPHSTGHGLGLDVHEAPRIARADLDAQAAVVEAGMVFTIEPGAYVPDVGGARIEDDVLVTRGGCELLTEAPRELVVV